jgi:hypothetical protein
MIIATGLIDVLIPLIAGIVVLVLPIRAKPPKLTEEKARTLRRTVRICGVVAICVAVGYFFIMLAERSR